MILANPCPKFLDGEPHDGHTWRGKPTHHGFEVADDNEPAHATYECSGWKSNEEFQKARADRVKPAQEHQERRTAEIRAEHAPPPGKLRQGVLDRAAKLVNGDRDKQYGEPKQNFARAADVLNGLGYSGPGGRRLVPSDVAKINIGLKLARSSHGDTLDTIDDVAGYAACWGEVFEQEVSEE